MAIPRSWPFDDDDDRPSGSVRPLSQADLQAILAHLGDPHRLLAGAGEDRPAVAYRCQPAWASRAAQPRPAGGGCGRPSGPPGSEPCPGRVAAIVVIGVAGSLLGSLLVPRLGLAVGGLAAVMAGWGPRFRPSPGACAWRRGVAGERTPLGCSRRWNGTG